MTISVRLLEQPLSWNLGDEIQTLAVRQHLSRFDGYIDRDLLDQAGDEPVAVVCQGWFAKRAKTFPFSRGVRPVWIGFHLSHHLVDVLNDPDVRSYFRDTGPIGCRDVATATRLSDHGIDTFVSGCMTTTFPRRATKPAVPRVYLVDTAGIPLPDHLRGSDSIRVTHQGAPWWSQQSKRALASELLAEYREHAALVITPRLHCALPCIAMGIPVVFVGDPDDNRLSPIAGLAEVIPFPERLRGESLSNRLERKFYWRREMSHRSWTGAAADLEEVKAARVALLRDGLVKVGASA